MESSETTGLADILTRVGALVSGRVAAVWVRVSDATSGNLPPLCARSGVRCLTRYRTVIADVPGWVEWLTWTSAWPWLALRGRVRHKARPGRLAVVLPLLPSRHARGRSLRLLRDASALGTLALLVAAVLLPATATGVALRAAAVLAAAHLVVALLGMRLTIGTNLDATAHWLRLSRVHRAFAAAAAAGWPQPTTPPLSPAGARRALRGGGRPSQAGRLIPPD